MELVQSYETSISDQFGRWTLNLLIVPDRSCQVRKLPTSRDAVEAALGFESIGDKISFLSLAIASLLRGEKMDKRAIDVYDQALRGFKFIEDDDFESALSFAEQAIHAEIPFENSPLGATSLAALLSHGTGTAVGAYIGFVVSGSGPLLLITVPAGMIICGAASGAATGLHDGLRSLISRWLTGKSPLSKRTTPKSSANASTMAELFGTLSEVPRRPTKKPNSDNT